MQASFEEFLCSDDVNLLLRFEKQDLTIVRSFTPEDVWDVEGKSLKKGWFDFARGKEALPPGFRLSPKNKAEIILGASITVRLQLAECQDALQTIRDFLNKYYQKFQGLSELAKRKFQLQQELKACEKELKSKCHDLRTSEQDSDPCDNCGGTGNAYWSDDVYGPCVHCSRGDSQPRKLLSRKN